MGKVYRQGVAGQRPLWLRHVQEHAAHECNNTKDISRDATSHWTSNIGLSIASGAGATEYQDAMQLVQPITSIRCSIAMNDVQRAAIPQQMPYMVEGTIVSSCKGLVSRYGERPISAWVRAYYSCHRGPAQGSSAEESNVACSATSDSEASARTPSTGFSRI